MPHKQVSISTTMEQSLLRRRDELDAKLVEMQRGLDDLARDEKDPLGNSGLQSAQNDIAHVQGRIDQIDDVLGTANVITDDPCCTRVAIGKRVVLHMHERECTGGEYEQLEVVIDGVKGFNDEETQVVTPESPVGAAIFGAVAEERRAFVSPRGKKFEIVIVSITSSS